MLSQQQLLPLMWVWLIMKKYLNKKVHYTSYTHVVYCLFAQIRNVLTIDIFTSLAAEIHIDRRCTLAELKTRLEEYVKVPSSEFKVHLELTNYCSCIHAAGKNYFVESGSLFMLVFTLCLQCSKHVAVL